MTAEDGVWVTYYRHPETGEPTIEGVWLTELDALRAANLDDTTKAAVLAYGDKADEALK